MIDIPVRALSNVEFNEKKRIITMKDGRIVSDGLNEDSHPN